jgi:peptidyl-prolyl cis-trans isomerase SurA
MKKWILFLVVTIIAKTNFSQSLISFGKYTISKEEFLKAYNKNKTAETDREKSIREYVELYTNFKMKVTNAKELKMDTISHLKTDNDNFRRQIEDNFLNDEKVFDKFMQLAFERSQTDLHVEHYFLPVSETATPQDTLQQYQLINTYYSLLQKIAPAVTKTPGQDQIKKTDLGFVTVFTLPYQYEDIVYGLKPGETSKPYRSKKGWHLFKLLEQRKSIGKWKVAQILFTFPPAADNETQAAVKKMADSVYLQLKQGADFSMMARAYSEDKLTYLNGGEMPEFGTGKYDAAFESEVGKLLKDGAISAPFQTKFGYHIVKRISVTPMSTDKEDESLKFELKQKLLHDDRIKAAKEKFARDLAPKVGFKLNSSINLAEVYRLADSVMNNIESNEAINKTTISKKVVISFTKETVKGADWLSYVREYRSNTENNKGESSKELWEKYKLAATLDYYRKHLEDFSADFSNQLQEFKEGNLLFEIMEQKIWSKAAIDSAGAMQYYKAHKKEYLWGESADVLIMNCSTKEIATAAMAQLKAGKSWRDIAQSNEGYIQADSGRFELTQINSVANLKTGDISPFTVNNDGSVGFLQYFRSYPSGGQRSFEDARGMIVNDYQEILEKNWIEQLKKKYPIKINEVLLKSIINDK